MFPICAPALIYLVFSITQILIDTFKGLYNTAIMKFVVMIMITLMLNILCINGLGVISWIIVFVPFILMTVIVSLLLWIFGLDAASGTLNYGCDVSGNKCVDNNISKDVSGNILIYNPYYDARLRPVVYRAPYIVVPPREVVGVEYDTTITKTTTSNMGVAPPQTRHSDPEYH